MVRVEVPYSGGTIDGPDNGTISKPWDIECKPSKQFASETNKIPVPHTEEVRVGVKYVR